MDASDKMGTDVEVHAFVCRLQEGHLPPALLPELAAGGPDSGSLRQSRPPHCLLGPQVSHPGGQRLLPPTHKYPVVS